MSWSKPRALVLAALGCLALLAPTVRAFVSPPAGTALPDMEARADVSQAFVQSLAVQSGALKPEEAWAGPAVPPGPARLAEVARLERVLGTRMVVRWNDTTGSPQIVWAREGFLTGPAEGSFEDLARRFLLAHRDLFLLDAGGVADLVRTSVVPTSSNGAVVWFEQRLAGRVVLHGHLGVGVTHDGRITHVTGGWVTGAGTLPWERPRHSPAQAFAALADAAGVKLPADVPEPAVQPDGSWVIALPGQLARPATVREVVIPTARGPRLGFEGEIAPRGSPSAYQVAVEDGGLALVRRANRTQFLDTRGFVFMDNPGDGVQVEERFPDTTAWRSDLSPRGWSAADMTEGNNTTVRDDIPSDDETTLGQETQATAPPPYQAFNFTWSGVPANDLSVGETHLFRTINLAHDHFYSLGFTEAAGNFQVSNMGRGGVEGDPVLGDWDDGNGMDANHLNNANFQTPPDGQSGRMQMYLWNLLGNGLQDGAMELDVVMHEYTHGVSTRLVGGPSDAACLLGTQGAAMGEGWSDFFADSYRENPIIGEWVSGDAVKGIRMFALDDNPATGKDYRNFCKYSNDIAPVLCEPHDNGEIWSGFLWLVRTSLATADTHDVGVHEAEIDVLDGLKLTPCSPSYLDARDAIILADRVNYAGAHECLIKAAAADRWMGFSASSNGGSDAAPTARNDAWPECMATGTLQFSRQGVEADVATPTYGCQDVVTVKVVDGNAVAPVTATVTTSGGDAETITLTASTDPAVWLGTIPTVSTPVAPADGRLQVTSGDTLTATYVDPDQVAPVTATAAISCAARLVIARHQVTHSTCDADTVAGFPKLPGFLDRNESADLDIYLDNLMSSAVVGNVRITTDRPDLMTILPGTASIPVHLPAAVGSSPAEIVVTVRVAGSATIANGDSCHVSLTLQAPGWDPTTTWTFQMLLNRDYQLVTGLHWQDDLEAETGSPVGPNWTTGLLRAGTGDQWVGVTCQNTTPGGTRSYHLGPSNCTSKYSDLQANPYLATPALPTLLPNSVDARLTNVAFQHHCDMGSFQNALDADATVLTVANDPSTIDTRDPLSFVQGKGLAVYANIDLTPDGIPFTLLSNTPGFVPQSIPVAPGALSDVDFTRPVSLTWIFLPDITPSQVPGLPFPVDAQATGYWLDDVDVTYDRVDVVDQDPGTTCTAVVTPFALPVITEPASGTTCAGQVVTIDATGSDAANCGPPVTLEYRFLVGGSPVACFADAAGTSLRVQDALGWGAVGGCNDFPAGDTTYDVEVRCASTPTPTDTRSVSVRIFSGNLIVDAQPPTFCARTPDTVVLDASETAATGCVGGQVLYRFTDSTGGALDCNGDTVPDPGFGPATTCVVGPSDVPLTFDLDVQCSVLPSCPLSSQVTIPSVDIHANGEFQDPTVVPPCPGESFTVTATGSVPTTVADCPGGTTEYRWRSPEGFDSGFGPQPDQMLSLQNDGELVLDVTCSLNPGCIGSFIMPVTLQHGAVAATSDASPTACAGSPFTLTATETTSLGCTAGTTEYRFLADTGAGPTVIACAGRSQDANGWATDATCVTSLIAGGASYTTEARCPSNPTCTAGSVALVVAPWDGVPTGNATLAGALHVRRTAGCPDPGQATSGDVILDWGSSSVAPQEFSVFRNSDSTLDLLGDRLADVSAATTYADPAVTCDGAGGARWHGVAVYYYVVFARNQCDGTPVTP